MQDSVDLLALQARAATIARRVVVGIRPDQFGLPTPCTEWDVGALLNHVTGLSRTIASGVAGDEGNGSPHRPDDLANDDPRTAFVEAVARADTALRTPGALERTHRLPWGEMPGALLARVAFMDLVIHAWDLAKATGQPTTLDPDLCQTALEFGRTMLTDEFRQRGGAFGAEVTVPADAPVCDRLAAFYGRQP